MRIAAQYTGFTLIELLIVISLIAVMSGAVLPAFSQYIDNQSLRQAQEQVKSDLRSVQNRALTGASADKMAGGNPVKYWGIKFPGTAGTSGIYKYFISDGNVGADCDASNDNNDPVQGEFSLPEDFVFRNSGCLFFSMANGDFNSIGIGANNRVIVGRASATVCRSVRSYSMGLVVNDASTLCN